VIVHQYKYVYDHPLPIGPKPVIFNIIFGSTGTFVTMQCKIPETYTVMYGKTLDIKDGLVQWFDERGQYWKPLSERYYPLEVRRYTEKLLKLKAFW
jgi:hypothetical protein